MLILHINSQQSTSTSCKMTNKEEKYVNEDAKHIHLTFFNRLRQERKIFDMVIIVDLKVFYIFSF